MLALLNARHVLQDIIPVQALLNAQNVTQVHSQKVVQQLALFALLVLIH